MYGSRGRTGGGGGVKTLSDREKTRDLQVCNNYYHAMTKKKTTEVEEGKKMKPRSANYSSREDEGITKAWGSATQNERKGNYQDQKKYWQTILEKYQVFAKDNNQRWRTINHACMKFNGIYLQISRVVKSGWNDKKYQAEAETIYLEEEGEVLLFWMLVVLERAS